MRRRWSLTAVLLICAPQAAAVQLLETAEWSDSRAVLTLRFACATRYLTHSQRQPNQLLAIKLRPQAGCEDLGSQSLGQLALGNAQYASVRDVVAQIDVVPGSGQTHLLLEFHEPERFTVSQGADSRSLVVAIRPTHDVRSDPPDTPPATAAAAIDVDIGQPQAALAEARQAVLAGDHAKAQQIYRALLVTDNPQAAEALEYLAVSYERSGRVSLAEETYEAYLSKYADSIGAARVRQRLAALRSRRQPPAPVHADVRDERTWRVRGELAQEFWQFDTRLEVPGSNTPEFEQSMLMTYFNATLDTQQQRWQLGSRLSMGYLDALDGDGGEDQMLVSQAYVQVADQQVDWHARLGRQTLYTDGVLGRFDGVRASYRLRPRLAFNVTAGVPVDAPRYVGDTDRPFLGASVAYDGIEDVEMRWYVQAQQDGGIASRQAIGAEVSWRGRSWYMHGLVDYDASFEVLNNALWMIQVDVHDRLRLYGRAQAFALPLLTTRNALIGQPVSSVDALLDRYTEGQIRTLARHRSTDAWSATIGATADLSERWSIRAETRYTDIDASVASADVAARPARLQFFSMFDLTGSSLLLNQDTWLFGARIDSSSDRDVATVLIDARFPVSASTRINPRLSVASREDAGGTQQWQAEGGLRLVKLFGRRYELQFEAGRRWFNREILDGLIGTVRFPEEEERTVENYVQLRWQVLF